MTAITRLLLTVVIMTTWTLARFENFEDVQHGINNEELLKFKDQMENGQRYWGSDVLKQEDVEPSIEQDWLPNDQEFEFIEQDQQQNQKIFEQNQNQREKREDFDLDEFLEEQGFQVGEQKDEQNFQKQKYHNQQQQQQQQQQQEDEEEEQPEVNEPEVEKKYFQNLGVEVL